MVDILSHGRLECGFVRGVPYEVLPANSNPVRMNERQWEAIDLIVKAWTHHDGPFSHEGRFFHHRTVNIWPRPYQQPHPPIWISTTSPSGAQRVGARGYVQATFLTGFEQHPGDLRALSQGLARGRPRQRRAGQPPRLCGDGLCRAKPKRTPTPAPRSCCGTCGANKVPSHLSQSARLHAGAGADARCCGARPSTSTPAMKDKMVVEKAIEAGIMFAGTPDQVLPADQEALRLRRRLRPSADHGPGRLPGA